MSAESPEPLSERLASQDTVWLLEQLGIGVLKLCQGSRVFATSQFDALLARLPAGEDLLTRLELPAVSALPVVWMLEDSLEQAWQMAAFEDAAGNLMLSCQAVAEAGSVRRLQLDQLCSAIPGAIYRLRRSADGYYTLPFIRGGLTQLYPLDIRALKELNPAELVHPDDRADYYHALEDSARQLAPLHHRYRHMVENGYRWVRSDAFPRLQPDGSTIWNGTLVDVHDIEESAGQLRLQSQVIANMEQSLVITDPHLPQNPIVFASQRFLAETGYSADEILGHNCRFLQGDGTSQATVQEIREALRARRLFRGEILNYRKDGTPFWNLLTISPVFDSQGRLSQFVGLQTDITELKANAASLERSNRDLRRQNQDLQNFAYIISHHLRAPVANLLGLSQMLALAPEPALQAKLLDGVQRSARQLDEVVGDLNTVISLRQELREAPETVELQPLLAEVWRGLQADGPEARLETDFGVATLVSVRSYLAAILQELLGNALRFRQPERPLSVRVQTRAEADGTLLEVCDNGRGMDLKTQGERLLGLYGRLHADVSGRGMGLYLLKSRLNVLGATLEIESEPGQGSCFRLHFSQEAEHV